MIARDIGVVPYILVLFLPVHFFALVACIYPDISFHVLDGLLGNSFSIEGGKVALAPVVFPCAGITMNGTGNIITFAMHTRAIDCACFCRSAPIAPPCFPAAGCDFPLSPPYVNVADLRPVPDRHFYRVNLLQHEKFYSIRTLLTRLHGTARV